MNILHILNISVPDMTGYTSRSKYIVEIQKKLGMNPEVITSPRQESCDQIEENINGIKYYRSVCSNNKRGGRLSGLPFINAVSDISILRRRLNDISSSNKYDIFHSHSPVIWGMPSRAVSRKLGIPFVYEVRALWEDAAVDQGKTTEKGLRYVVTKKLETYLLKKADAVVAICEGLREEIIGRGVSREKVHVVPNGVDTDRFVPLQKDQAIVEKYSLAGCRVIGFIGSFYRFEGLDILLEAVPDILKNSRDVKFLIVGAGKENDNLISRAEQLGIKENVIFTGRVPHGDIMKYYSVVDIFIYPRLSRRITNMVTPIKPLEAMSMEKAVIASDVGGLKELVKDGQTGLLFKAEDSADLTEKCIRLLGDPESAVNLGHNARKEMILARDFTKIVGKYECIYKECIERYKNEDN